MVTAKGCFLDGSQVQPLARLYRWSPGLPIISIITDASTTSLGAVLMVGGQPAAYYAHTIRESDCAVIGGGARTQDPTYQSEWELLCIFVAVRLFSKAVSAKLLHILVQSDSTSALEAATLFKAQSPLMARLACELAIEVEALHQCPLGTAYPRGAECFG